MSYLDNILRIRAVHDALGELANDVVFVGGATVALYSERQSLDVRPTTDVDILVELYTRTQYAALEELLRAKGFHPDTASNVICRYIVNDVTVDVMPIEESILGFSNRWYEEGYQHAIPCQMDDRYTVRIFSAPYFIASKLEAFKGRGKGDGRTSHDFEDIVFVFNNRSAVWQELEEAPQTVKAYLQETTNELVQNPSLLEWIEGHLEYHERTRASLIVDRLRQFAAR